MNDRHGLSPVAHRAVRVCLRRRLEPLRGLLVSHAVQQGQAALQVRFGSRRTRPGHENRAEARAVDVCSFGLGDGLIGALSRTFRRISTAGGEDEQDPEGREPTIHTVSL